MLNPPPHHGPHGPNDHIRRPPAPRFHQRHLYPEQAVGVLGRLLDRAGDFGDLETLTEHLTKREPGELKYLSAAVAELIAAGREATPKHVLRVMADSKAMEFFRRDKERVLRGLKGNGTPTPDQAPLHALVGPAPRHDFYLLEDITPGKVYWLPGHAVPIELEEWEIPPVPTRSRHIKAELAGVQSITFEGYVHSDGNVLTRSLITDLLSDLADAGVKPLLRVIEMPHLPHHEEFRRIDDGYQIEIIT